MSRLIAAGLPDGLTGPGLLPDDWFAQLKDAQRTAPDPRDHAVANQLIAPW